MWDHPEHFERMYARHYEAVYRYALRRTSAAVAPDVVAETFLTAWRRPDAVPAEPLPWLYGVARGVLANERRRVQRSASLSTRLHAVRPTAGAAGDHSEHVAESERVAAAMLRLPPRDQEVLRLIAWEDLDIRGAATALGCSPTAARVRLHRARRRLARLLDRAGDHASSPAAPSPVVPLPAAEATRRRTAS